MSKLMSQTGQIIHDNGKPVTYWRKKSAVYDAWRYGAKYKAECYLVKLPVKLFKKPIRYTKGYHVYIYPAGMFKRYGVYLRNNRKGVDL